MGIVACLKINEEQKVLLIHSSNCSIIVRDTVDLEPIPGTQGAREYTLEGKSLSGHCAHSHSYTQNSCLEAIQHS